MEEIVRVFGVSLATVGCWLRRRRETGDVAAGSSPGRIRRICSSAEERRALWAQLEAHPEATLEEYRQLWERESGGVRVSGATTRGATRRLGWTYKKDGGSL